MAPEGNGVTMDARNHAPIFQRHTYSSTTTIHTNRPSSHSHTTVSVSPRNGLSDCQCSVSLVDALEERGSR